MQLAHRVFEKDGQTWVAGLGVVPLHVDCYTAGAKDGHGYTPFEQAQLEGDACPTTPERAIELFQELTRRREAEGWVEQEFTRSLRCFHKPDDPLTTYWSIQLNFLRPGREVQVLFGPSGEIGSDGHPIDKRRTQVREFEDREALRRWYASEVARRLAEGYTELFPHPSDFSDLGSDPSILSEDVDAGELTSDSYAEPGSPTALWMETKRRTCLVPETTEGDGPDTASKFSGLPWLAKAEDWPECPTCRVPMQHLVQVNLDELPSEVGSKIGRGLLQFFACLRDECSEEEENFLKPYPKNQIRRIVEPLGPGQATIPEGLEPFPPKLITGWTLRDDYPSSEERGWMDDEDGENIVTSEGLSEQYPTLAGDKLGGWPYWIQDVEYPECERCGEVMRLLLQLDSFDNIPHRWGDNGVAHLTQCDTHKNVIAFDWACG